MSSDPRAFIRAHSAIAAPPLVPELRLHLASELTPLWHATEATLAQHGLAPPFWAFAWPGGQALARYLLDRPMTVRSKRVLDFGAGSGLVALAAAKAGAACVTAAEIDPFAAAAVALNAALNQVTVAIEAVDLIGAGSGPWDIVVAGDLCYEQPLAGRLVPWLRTLAGRGIDILLGDPGRHHLPKQGVTRLARYDVPTSLELEDSTMRETGIWRLAADPVAA